MWNQHCLYLDPSITSIDFWSMWCSVRINPDFNLLRHKTCFGLMFWDSRCLAGKCYEAVLCHGISCQASSPGAAVKDRSDVSLWNKGQPCSLSISTVLNSSNKTKYVCWHHLASSRRPVRIGSWRTMIECKKAHPAFRSMNNQVLWSRSLTFLHGLEDKLLACK